MKDFIEELDNLLLGKYDSFKDLELPCITPLYNWINAGITETKPIDLTKKPKLCSKRVKHDTQKHCFGKSIDARPIEADRRSEIGHFEIDTIQGKKTARLYLS
ncbi:hypothetical protein [Ligilactobacillus agilis]|uniref:hypothetical protein n=1 Tax=Ligilactobacillus agilis TaxID=1601 RepID=UPI002A870395|nr:hypothetical protein [Ligilactobacillus agilis]